MLEGSSPFAAIDFQQSSEVFAPLPLDRSDGRAQPAELHLRNLSIFNLPQTLAASDELSVAGISPSSLSALLWISKAHKPREDTTLYVLDSVTASVSCTEVTFLKGLFQRLRNNAAESESSDMVVEFTACSPFFPALCRPMLLCSQSCMFHITWLPAQK